MTDAANAGGDFAAQYESVPIQAPDGREIGTLFVNIHEARAVLTDWLLRIDEGLGVPMDDAGLRARVQHYMAWPLARHRLADVFISELRWPAPSEQPRERQTQGDGSQQELLPIEAEQIANSRALVARGLLAFNLIAELQRPVSKLLPSAPRLVGINDPVQRTPEIGGREPTLGEYVATAWYTGDRAALDAIDRLLRSRQQPGAKRAPWPDILLRYQANARLVTASLTRRREFSTASKAWATMLDQAVEALPHSDEAELAGVLRALEAADLKVEWMKPRPPAKEVARLLTAFEFHVSAATLKKELAKAARRVPRADK
jgi:hypothetical protein